MSDAHPELAYLDLLRELLDHGTYKNDRTGTGTYSKFGHQMRYDLSKGFPLFTTKRLHLRSIIHELLWFLTGDTNVGYLNRHGVTIWDEWAGADGDLGPVYGKQWRSWDKPDGGTIDQMSGLVEEIKRNPDSRRLIVTAWNPADIEKMALAPCHCLFQYYVADNKLSCQLYQRSADSILGIPFNTSCYVLLQYMIAQQCNLGLGDFVHTFGDVHLYANHVEQARTQIAREPRPFPRMLIKRKPASLFDYAFEDFEIVGYEPHAAIKAPVAV